MFGVPYFVVDGEPIWGVDRMWMVEHWGTRHTWRGRNNPRAPASGHHGG